MITSYDVKRKTEGKDPDGLPTITWATQSTYRVEVQPMRWDKDAQVEIEIGGVKYVPTYKGFLDYNAEITATDRITENSGVTNLLVLRVHRYEDHNEIDLIEDQGE